MGSVYDRLLRRAVVVLAALLLALAVAPASASSSPSGQTQRAASSLIYVATAGLATELSGGRSAPLTRGAQAVDRSAAVLASFAAPPLRCREARLRLPHTCNGRYQYLMHCALLC
jgi:hypothetical protein